MPDGSQTQEAKALIAEEIALALMGARALKPERIAEGANWQKGSKSLIGRNAIVEAAQLFPRDITINEIVSHGKAAAVSGKARDARGRTHLFCHMIRFTNASAGQVASIVSFEHATGPSKRANLFADENN